ncbi:MAG: 16S rRNA (guanine(527)-N(7))-methyltransferase RsmG [Bdellovibrio sp. 28-41-41]|nr:MAG: 16S rRNA (guanine(527)-N(7))-methyltransferase RsmG [Bdellovibrio sp. 28-41-41]
MHFEARIPLILELGFREDGIDALKSYVDLLWKSNEELNLISRKMTFNELIDNHIIDGLLPLKMFPKEVTNVADFGSGGGIPGVVYAIHFSKIAFTLFEKSAKKREFLEGCHAIASNLKIQGEIPPHLTDYDLVTARAFKPLDVILDISRNYYKQGGHYFLLKGRREKIDEEIELSKKKFKDLKIAIHPLKSPILEVERHLVTNL